MEAQNDQIIAKVFWRSVLVLGVVAVGVVLVVVFLRGDAEQEAVEVSPPQTLTISVHPPQVSFTDVTQASGISFRHENGAYGERLLPETMGGGVAFLDVDNDGDQDLIFVNSSRWPWREETSPSPAAELYLNRGDGTFQPVTAGFDESLYGMGIATGDYDDDGYTDVFLSALGANRLYRNLNGERFEDVTDTTGVAGHPEQWSTSAAFFDFDRDGDLDLFVTNYVEWSRAIDLAVDYRLAGIGRAYGPPNNYAGTHAYLYENVDGRHFVDVSVQTGVQVENPVSGQAAGKGLGVTPVDIDADGWLDLVVANDTVANFLFHNDRGRFEETAVVAGLAYDNEGAATGAMGIDAARDRNRDETTIVMGNFANEMSSFYVSQNHGEVFTDEAMLSGIGPGTRQALSFGVFFFDYDLDGKLDYLQVGGHIENDINLVQSSQHYEQAAQLYWHCGVQCPRNFVAVTPDTLADLATPRVGRGAAYADIDADGDLDIVITQVAGAAVLLRNDQALGHHWLRIKLRGSAGNQSAIGASVTLHTDGLVQHRRVTPARSYLSQVELPVTFGLGLHDTVEKVVVIWPDGSRSEHRNLKVDTTHVIGQTEP